MSRIFFWPLSLHFPHGCPQVSFPGRASWGKPFRSGFNCVLFVHVLEGFLGGFLVLFGVWGLLFWKRGPNSACPKAVQEKSESRTSTTFL